MPVSQHQAVTAAQEIRTAVAVVEDTADSRRAGSGESGACIIHSNRGRMRAHQDSHVDNFAAQIESNYDETTDSFDSMQLKAELLRGVYAYGFERPSAIQQRAIMPVIKGELACAVQPYDASAY